MELAELPSELAEVPVIGGVALVIALALLVAGATMLVVPALVLTAEAIVLGLLVVIGVVLRVTRRRPWTIEATATDTGERHTWSVMGWRAGGKVAEQVAADLANPRSF